MRSTRPDDIIVLRHVVRVAYTDPNGPPRDDDCFVSVRQTLFENRTFSRTNLPTTITIMIIIIITIVMMVTIMMTMTWYGSKLTGGAWFHDRVGVCGRIECEYIARRISAESRNGCPTRVVTKTLRVHCCGRTTRVCTDFNAARINNTRNVYEIIIIIITNRARHTKYYIMYYTCIINVCVLLYYILILPTCVNIVRH